MFEDSSTNTKYRTGSIIEIDCKNCNHGKQVENAEFICLVTREKGGRYRYCSYERTIWGKCKPSGLLFEPTEPGLFEKETEVL